MSMNSSMSKSMRSLEVKLQVLFLFPYNFLFSNTLLYTNIMKIILGDTLLSIVLQPQRRKQHVYKSGGFSIVLYSRTNLTGLWLYSSTLSNNNKTFRSATYLFHAGSLMHSKFQLNKTWKLTAVSYIRWVSTYPMEFSLTAQCFILPFFSLATWFT